MDQKTPANDSSVDKSGAEEGSDETLKTPVRPSKGTKRKLQETPTTTPSKPEDGGSVKKRRKSSSGTALSRVGSPSTSLLKPAMTERQQMALLLQMTDPSKQQSPVSPAVVSGPITPETTPKRLQRRNERGETPLHVAAIKGDLKSVTSLLCQGADVKATDHAGWTPLHEACNYGHSAVARELLAHNADVGAVGMDGDTPMHDAVVNGHLETVRVLLQHGGNPHHANEKGLTPIDICTNPDILALLKSCDQDHTHPENKGQSTIKEEKVTKTTEDPYPKRRHSSNQNDDVSDKEDDYTPVFSPETGKDSLTTPTPELKKARLRDVSFSDITSSEDEMDTKGDSKECGKDDAHTDTKSDKTSGESEKVGMAPPEMAAKKDTEEKGTDVAIKEEDSSPQPVASQTGSPSKDTQPSLSESNQDSPSPPPTRSPVQAASPAGSHSEDQPAPRAIDTGNHSDTLSVEMDQPQILASGRILRSAVKSPESEKLIMSISLSLVELSTSGCDLRRREHRLRADSEELDSSPRSLVTTNEALDSSGGSSNWRAPDMMADSKGVSPHDLSQSDARRNSSSSVESGHDLSVSSEGVTRVRGDGMERVHTKHSRKPQYVFSGKRMLKEGRKERNEDERDRESFSVSLDWSNIKSPTDTTPSVHITHGPIRMQSEDEPDYIRTLSDPTPLPSNHSNQNDTVISFRTSLPLVFTCHPTPSTTANVSGQYRSKSRPTSPEGIRAYTTSGLSSSTPDISCKRERSSCQADLEALSLPPKKRYRPVMKSAVVHQRMVCGAQVSEATDLPPLSLTGDYRSKKPITLISPKMVYPPLPPSMYKQFSDQEAERGRLATAHLVEQDRLRLSFVQELLRAQQRAKKGQAPITACAILLEKLLPPVPPPDQTISGLKVESEHSPFSTKPRESEEMLNSRLLSGLVQDVWDKFRVLKFSLLARQKQEAEALWLTQREQWAHLRKELGGVDNSLLSDIPVSHVPLVSQDQPSSPVTTRPLP